MDSAAVDGFCSTVIWYFTGQEPLRRPTISNVRWSDTMSEITPRRGSVSPKNRTLFPEKARISKPAKWLQIYFGRYSLSSYWVYRKWSQRLLPFPQTGLQSSTDICKILHIAKINMLEGILHTWYNMIFEFRVDNFGGMFGSFLVQHTYAWFIWFYYICTFCQEVCTQPESTLCPVQKSVRFPLRELMN